MKLQELGEEIEAHADDIVEGAEELADQEPWVSLPEELRLNHLIPLLRSMVRAAFDEVGEEVTVRDLVEEAAEHGRQRAEQGFTDETVLLEYQILRRAVERFLRSGYVADEVLLEALVRMDAEITTATSGSLLGLHDADMDVAAAREALEQLVARRKGAGGAAEGDGAGEVTPP